MALDEDGLRELAYRYATGIDRRDAELFVSVFQPDARVRVFNPSESGEPVTDVAGHEALARFTARIARYAKTFHFVGNTRYDVATSGSTATGEVYCMAHHLSDAGSDHVMFIRYLDEYRRDDTDTWLIADRRVMVDWTETRPV